MTVIYDRRRKDVRTEKNKLMSLCNKSENKKIIQCLFCDKT